VDQASKGNQESQVAVNRSRHPYEDTNDTRFLQEFTTNKDVRRENFDSERKDRKGEIEEIELMPMSRNASNEHLLSTYCNTSEEDTTDGREKKKRSPYESCHNVDFLKEYTL
jgi:hypothetical protein